MISESDLEHTLNAVEINFESFPLLCDSDSVTVTV
jgi:hypothetical protein